MRIEVDDSDNTMGAKIRNHQLQKVPYMLIVGDDEAENGTVSVRPRSGKEQRDVPVSRFAEKVAGEVAERSVKASF